jgi:hypothetical protein
MAGEGPRDHCERLARSGRTGHDGEEVIPHGCVEKARDPLPVHEVVGRPRNGQPGVEERRWVHRLVQDPYPESRLAQIAPSRYPGV